MDSGGTVGGAQQQQGSASRVSAVGRCLIPTLFLNIYNLGNLFNSWIVCMLMLLKGEMIRWNKWKMKTNLINWFG
jgi:hypothetical protein